MNLYIHIVNTVYSIFLCERSLILQNVLSEVYKSFITVCGKKLGRYEFTVPPCLAVLILMSVFTPNYFYSKLNEPRREKTGLRGL